MRANDAVLQDCPPPVAFEFASTEICSDPLVEQDAVVPLAFTEDPDEVSARWAVPLEAWVIALLVIASYVNAAFLFAA